jgi:uncharacterized protein YecT (DUF1311 family)
MTRSLTKLIVAIVLALAAGSAGAVACATDNDGQALACSKEELRQSDSEVVTGVETLLSVYDDRQRQSLIDGQAKWLKLRDEACTWDGKHAADFNGCRVRVDNERTKELSDLAEIQHKYTSDKHPGVDLEAVLDKPMDLAAYDRETQLGKLYFESSLNETRIPNTCRELYTLSAGDWNYTADTIGMNAAGNAYDSCSQLIGSAQRRKSAAFSDVNFQDVSLLAEDLLCFAFRCGDGYSLYGGPSQSFLSLSKQKKLKIVSGTLPAWGDNACAGTLTISPPFFCIDGYNVRYQMSEAGDFTGRGRREALLSVLFFASDGSTQRLHDMFLASYDPVAKSIRVEEIDSDSHIKIRLRGD